MPIKAAQTIEYETTIIAFTTVNVIAVPADEYFSSMSTAGNPVPTDVSVVHEPKKVTPESPITAALSSPAVYVDATRGPESSLSRSGYLLHLSLSAQSLHGNSSSIPSSSATFTDSTAPTSNPYATSSKTYRGPVSQFTGSASKQTFSLGVLMAFIVSLALL